MRSRNHWATGALSAGRIRAATARAQPTLGAIDASMVQDFGALVDIGRVSAALAEGIVRELPRHFR
jgi:hypothetical protein